MKWYIAAFDKLVAQQLRTVLRQMGHEVVSTWLDEETYGKPKTDAERAMIAVKDRDECLAADALVIIEDGQGQGGRHVEYGMVLGMGGACHVIGQRRANVFQFAPGVMLHPSIEAFATWVSAIRSLPEEDYGGGTP